MNPAMAAAKSAREAVGTSRYAPIGTKRERAVEIECTGEDSDDDVEPGDEDDCDGDSEANDAVADAFAGASAHAATPARRSRESGFPRRAKLRARRPPPPAKQATAARR